MQILWATVFFFAFSLQATIAVIHDIQTMTHKSGVVVQAKVIEQKVTQDPQGRMITLTTLRVEDGMKGAKTGQDLTLYQVGGELNGHVMRLQGASVYRKGEDLVLFAVPYQDKMIVSYGLGLGKFNVLNKKAEFQVVEDIHGLEIQSMKAGRTIIEGPSPRKYRSLEALKAEIRKAL